MVKDETYKIVCLWLGVLRVMSSMPDGWRTVITIYMVQFIHGNCVYILFFNDIGYEM